jgi:hypothetical protein
MSPKSFFSSLEEIFARFFSLVLSLIFFVIYVIAAGNKVELNVVGILQTTLVFWLIYETISFILFTVFRFFASRSTGETSEPEIKLEENDDNTINL